MTCLSSADAQFPKCGVCVLFNTVMSSANRALELLCILLDVYSV